MEELLAIGLIIAVAILFFNIGQPLFRHINEEMAAEKNDKEVKK